MESKLDSIEDLSKLRAMLKSLKEAPGSNVVEGESWGVAAVCVIIGTVVSDDTVVLFANIFDSWNKSIFSNNHHDMAKFNPNNIFGL